ncbi:MAG: ribosomal RNA small subunit methyltransferase A, partial [Candidatus Omnitrophota bacterium]
MFPLKNVLAKYNLRTKKRLGQNFLKNIQSLQAIINTAKITDTEHILEIGAGIGNLSTLIAQKAGRFYVLEKDIAFKHVLNDSLSKYTNTKIIFSDILKFDLKTIYTNKKLKIIGNLPFYITSPILKHLINQKEYIQTILITIQKEVAQRIIARENTKSYGRLSCFLQFYTIPKLHLIFQKKDFYPIPKVDSALLELKILDTPAIKVQSEKIFFNVVNAIFSLRRKTLLNALIGSPLQIKKTPMQNILENLK